MKTLQASLVLMTSATLMGCATGKSGLVLEDVGPMPAHATTPDAGNGTLVVYSAYEPSAEFNERDSRRPEHSDYKIFSTDGKLLRRVHNDAGNILQDPAAVNLPAGRYRVVARANGYGYVTVPVDMAPDQTTILRLAGDESWSEDSAYPSTNAVRLPDGRIVGWRDSPGS